ncbi:scinderin like a [Epinephelus fuscoguttatus]|uniref:scinderin like a n=1 Tax=Epinephelus fuscoguttatus TaxID=293821 RepID=UPI0020D09F2B|nr:scinderin like a [Epinephelus fuscoguttatus]XP_049444452.1 scinderin like a [Epinephelus fuscoguttatus]
MASHKEFETAGKKPGLQVWRIENMELAPIPVELYGSFYNGDSYIVLHTTADFSYNVHTWFGENTSQDERGAAAILMIQMDDQLNGLPTQHTEYQNEESLIFLKYFKSGVRYMEGGVASGFQQVVTNEVNVKRVLHVKGRRVIRASEVPLSWSSFNKGDCFIIDLGKVIYHWSGSESNFFECLKATEVAKDIRDNERHGRATIEMIEEGSEPEAVIEVLGPKPDLPSCEDEKKCDETADRKNKKTATLYLISDAAGSMKTTEVAKETPFKQDMLSQNECYILYNEGDKNLFVWKGKDANADERKEALNRANKFIKDNNCDPHTKIQIMPAGAETSIFKQFFFNWLDKDETTGPSEAYVENRIAKVEQIPFDASKLHSNKCMAAQHRMVDDGSGKTEIWRVEGGDKKPVDKSTYGQFFGGDCYLVLYTYKDGGREKFIIYTWQGQKCSKDELGASAILTIQLDDSMGGKATQVCVPQGQEPPHLVSMFKDPLIVYLGGTGRHDQESKPNSTRLFHIRQSSNKSTRAVEVEPKASSLNTNDAFVLKEGNSVYIWKGKGATQEEMTAANYVVSVLAKGKTAKVVEETEEPDDFWKALGGKAEYQTSKTLQKTVKPPRLFGCSNKTGNLIAEEVPCDFTQLDLAPDDVMILDIWDEVFIWVGKDANETEKAGVTKIAQDYLESDPSGRCHVPIATIKQGEEPVTFTGWFHAWDPDMWSRFEEDDYLQKCCKK